MDQSIYLSEERLNEHLSLFPTSARNRMQWQCGSPEEEQEKNIVSWSQVMLLWLFRHVGLHNRDNNKGR